MDCRCRDKEHTSVCDFKEYIATLCLRLPKNNGLSNDKFDYKTLTTKDLFIYVHKILNVKIHLHHSHVTLKKILSYTHDFCNEKVRENKGVFSCVAFLASTFTFL